MVVASSAPGDPHHGAHAHRSGCAPPAPEASKPLDRELPALDESAFSGFKNHAARIRGRDGEAILIADHVLPLPEGAFTVEAWVNPRETSKKAAVISKAEKSDFVLSVIDGTPRFKVHAGGEYRKAVAGAPLGNNRWTHLAGVYDGREVRLYVAGRMVACTPTAGSVTSKSLPTMIGADPDANARPQFSFDGLIDEVRISRGVRYAGGRAFEPRIRMKRDGDTLVLLHFDRLLAGFVPSDDAAGRHARVVGEPPLLERAVIKP